MGSVLAPELGYITDPGGGVQGGVTRRQRAEILRGQLETERATFMAHWLDLAKYIEPRRARFTITDTNKGDRRNQAILDSTATKASRTLAAGMMSGISSPSRPWFRVTIGDPDLMELESVKAWCFEATRRMHAAFALSNVYNALPLLYKDMGVFGTAAMIMEDDDEHVFRFTTFPIGTYAIANDAKGRVRTFLRTFRLTARQVMERWGGFNPRTGKFAHQEGRPSAVSVATRNLFDRGNTQAWVDIVHVIQPNVSYDGRRVDRQYKAFEDLYYERGAPNQPAQELRDLGLLAHGGFDEFPVLAPRWEVAAEDTYATMCPGMMALGDIRELQARTKRAAQAEEKMINPPLMGDTSLKTARVSMLPGDVTYITGQVNPLKPIHEVNFGAAFQPLELKAQAIRRRIESAFYADLFLMMMTLDERAGEQPATATEIAERKEEKLLALGPMLEQLNQDVFDPMIHRGFNIMFRKGLLPAVPEEMAGATWHVEYTSIMAQAQKMAGVASLDRSTAFVGQLAQFKPEVLDTVDADELVHRYFEAMGAPPKVLRDPRQVAALRAQREQAAAAQQAAQNIPQVAGAVKDLASAPTTGDSVLATLLAKQNARSTLGATAQPPAPVTP